MCPAPGAVRQTLGGPLGHRAGESPHRSGLASPEEVPTRLHRVPCTPVGKTQVSMPHRKAKKQKYIQVENRQFFFRHL